MTNTDTTENTTRFWYKGMGCGQDGVSKVWEGGFRAQHLGVALGGLRGMSLMWNAKELYWIAVYEVDQDGVVGSQPVMWQSLGKGQTGEQICKPDPNQFLLEGPDPAIPEYTIELMAEGESLPLEGFGRVPVRDVIKTYDESDWMYETNFPSTFTTITLKETDHDSINRG